MTIMYPKSQSSLTSDSLLYTGFSGGESDSLRCFFVTLNDCNRLPCLQYRDPTVFG